SHVLTHQTIFGEEALLQLANVKDYRTCSLVAPVAGRTSASALA
ncbi:MAG: putative alternative tryptophan synthase beta-subunit, partial [Ilumatobacter sp.]